MSQGKVREWHAAFTQLWQKLCSLDNLFPTLRAPSLAHRLQNPCSSPSSNGSVAAEMLGSEAAEALATQNQGQEMLQGI